MTRLCPTNCPMEKCPYDGTDCAVKETLDEEHRQFMEELYQEWQSWQH